MERFEAPHLRFGTLVSKPRRPPTRLQIIGAQVRFAWKMMLHTRNPACLAELFVQPVTAIFRWLEGRVYFIDRRGNVSLNWKNPLAPIVAAALMPLGLVASLGIRVYLVVAGRRR